MPDIIKEYREPSTSDRFAQAFSNIGQAAGRAIPQYLMQKEQRELEKEKLQKENEAVNRLGIDISGITDPKMRQESLASALKGKYEKEKTLTDEFLDKKSFEHIQQTFGPKFAGLWKAAPVGGKTELLKHGIDAVLRGDDLEEMLDGVEPPQQQQNEEQLAEVPQLKKGKLSQDFEWPDYTKRPQGYTPRDWSEERKTWRKENSPIYLENKTRLQGIKKDEMGIKKLQQLNPKLPKGFEKTIIDSETGEIRGVAQLAGIVSPEAQQWVKEIARFQNRAKDAFGSRVTNFDLMSYMKQFPSLLNSEEGRRRILDMMEINNKLDTIYDTALQKIYQKYGLSGIPQEEADNLAQRMVEKESKELYDRYLSLDEENQKDTGNSLSGKMIDVIGPDGEEYELDQSEMDQLPEGFRLK